MDHHEMPTQHQQPATSSVDTSRPFRSVKEAVAVFGERLLVRDVYSSPKPSVSVAMQEIMTSSPTRLKEDEQHHVIDTLKKLEAELVETKEELRLLKEREDDTEVALASLNAELHKNMSKLAEAEAAAAAKAAATRRVTVRMEEGKSESESPTLAEILSIGEKRGYFGGKKERKKMKKKPIIPLVGELFSRKKASSLFHDQRPLYPSSHLFN